MANRRSSIAELLEIMAHLRDPERGCPWDQEQTFESIAPYTIEEAYEVADAITRHDSGGLAEELGDLLFQVVFHAQLAREAGLFTFEDVARGAVQKMVRRHPHVFGDARVESAQAQTVQWEAHKAAEREARGGASESLMDGVARGLPAFRRALKLQEKAARGGFDWATAREVLAKLREEIDEIEAAMDAAAPRHRLAEELGDLLFGCVNLARHLRADPELALRQADGKFAERFRRMERLLAEEGASLHERTLDELEAAWQRVKGEEE